jgi:hypothetical protein
MSVSLDAPRAYAVAPHDWLTDRLSAGRVTRVTQVAEPVARYEPGTMTYPKVGSLAGLHQLPTGVHGIDVSEPVVPIGSSRLHVNPEDAQRTQVLEPIELPPSIEDWTSAHLDAGAGASRTPRNSSFHAISSAHQAPSSREAIASYAKFPGEVLTVRNFFTLSSLTTWPCGPARNGSIPFPLRNSILRLE